MTVTALESGRSPHGGGQRYVAVLLLRIRLLLLPASHPLAKLVIFFCHRLKVLHSEMCPDLVSRILSLSLFPRLGT